MLFPSDDVYRQRREIIARIAAGEITDLEGAREAIEADPHDALSLLFVAKGALLAGNLEEAERFARETIRNHPNGHEGYTVRALLLEIKDPDSSLAWGYRELATLNRRSDDDDTGPEFLPEDAELLRGIEPPEVENELRPYRLIHQLREQREEVLEREVVDEILANAEACEPLLLGILKEYAEDMLEDCDFSVVERALALLGEIGNVSSLPAIAEFLSFGDEDLGGPADWAFRRIASRRPEAAVAEIRKILVSFEPDDAAILGEQLASIGDVPGRNEALDELAVRVASIAADVREPFVFATITSFYLTEGEHSPRAKAMELEYAASFSKEARTDLRRLHKEIRDLPPYEPDPGPDDLTVYDICCIEPPEVHDHDQHHHHQEPVLVAPKPGRNEPCACGSGKKYKKCHLDEDQHA